MMQDLSIDAGILNRHTKHPCVQLEAPEIPEPTDPNIPQATADSTFQLPFGDFSALSELRLGNLRSVEVLLLTVLNYRSKLTITLYTAQCVAENNAYPIYRRITQ